MLTDFVGDGLDDAREKARRGSAGLAFDPARGGWSQIEGDTIEGWVVER